MAQQNADRDLNIMATAKILGSLDTLKIPDRQNMKDGPFVAYPQYRGKPFSYVVADLLIAEEAYTGASDYSDIDTLITRFSLNSYCQFENQDSVGVNVYSCSLLRISHTNRIDRNGAESPAFRDGEGYTEILQYKLKVSTDNHGNRQVEILNNQANFNFAG